MSFVAQLADSATSIVDVAMPSFAAEPPEPPNAKAIAVWIQHFVAPIAATIIGLFSLKFLFGDSRSMTGFLGFALLGVAVFLLLWFGESIILSAGKMLSGWAS